MSHNVTLQCGCLVYVACHPHTGLAHTRVLEYRHPGCPVRKHEIGLRLALWELLPEPLDRVIDPLTHSAQPSGARATRGRAPGSGRKSCDRPLPAAPPARP